MGYDSLTPRAFSHDWIHKNSLVPKKGAEAKKRGESLVAWAPWGRWFMNSLWVPAFLTTTVFSDRVWNLKIGAFLYTHFSEEKRTLTSSFGIRAAIIMLRWWGAWLGATLVDTTSYRSHEQVRPMQKVFSTHLWRGRDRRCSCSKAVGKGKSALKASRIYCPTVERQSTDATMARWAQSSTVPIKVISILLQTPSNARVGALGTKTSPVTLPSLRILVYRSRHIQRLSFFFLDNQVPTPVMLCPTQSYRAPVVRIASSCQEEDVDLPRQRWLRSLVMTNRISSAYNKNRRVPRHIFFITPWWHSRRNFVCYYYLLLLIPTFVCYIYFFPPQVSLRISMAIFLTCSPWFLAAMSTTEQTVQTYLGCDSLITKHWGLRWGQGFGFFTLVSRGVNWIDS